MPRPGSRILMLGGDTDFNVGDRAILTALVSWFSKHAPGVELSIVGQTVAHAELRGVSKVIPRGPGGLRALLAAAASANRILIAGGGLFQDDDSRAKMPYWAARIALLKAFGPRIAALSIGAGPLSHPESRTAARIACAALTRVSVRDRYARDALAPCTSQPLEIVPDPTFMLDPAPRPEAAAVLERLGLSTVKPLIVAVVRRWYHARGGFVPNRLQFSLGIEPRRDHARFESMQRTVADAVELLAARLDADILLLPSYHARHEADDAACEALILRLPHTTARIARIPDPRLYKAVVGRASLVVSARMHPLIFAASMGVPFVGLSYNGKFDGLYDMLGLDARCLPLDQCPEVWGASTLVAAAEAALASRTDLRRRAEALAATTRVRVLAAAFGAAEARALETAGA